MKKLLFVALIFSSPALQATPLFSLLEQSGFVSPEYYFKRTCDISQDGILSREVEKAVKNGNRWEFKIVESQRILLMDTLIGEMLTQLEMASKGTLKKRPAPCDVGATSYTGKLRGALIPLFELENCGYILSNSAPEAELLVSKLKELCKSK